MPMKAIHVRFDPDALMLVEAEAAQLGVSLAEFLRGAGLARAMFLFARRGDEPTEQLGELYEVAARAAAHPHIPPHPKGRP